MYHDTLLHCAAGAAAGRWRTRRRLPWRQRQHRRRPVPARHAAPAPTCCNPSPRGVDRTRRPSPRGTPPAPAALRAPLHRPRRCRRTRALAPSRWSSARRSSAAASRSEAFSGFNPDYQRRRRRPRQRAHVGRLQLRRRAGGRPAGQRLHPQRRPGARARRAQRRPQPAGRERRSSASSAPTSASTPRSRRRSRSRSTSPASCGRPVSTAACRPTRCCTTSTRAGGIDPDRGSYLAGGRAARRQAARAVQPVPLPARRPDRAAAAAGRRHHRRGTAPAHGAGRRRGAQPLHLRVRQAARSAPTDLLAVARPRPGATHLSIVRKVGADRRSEYHPLADAARGDDPGRRRGHRHLRQVPRHDPRAHRRRAPRRRAPWCCPTARAEGRDRAAAPGAAGQRRRAAALPRARWPTRQKELLETSLRSLETYALTARSATSEEAALRTREAELILQFIERATTRAAKGQVVLARQRRGAGDTLLEDGDVIRVPEPSNLVLVSGEVTFPTHSCSTTASASKDYVTRAGGYTQGADRARVVVMHQDGSVADDRPDGHAPGRRDHGAAEDRDQDRRDHARHHADRLPDRGGGAHRAGLVTLAGHPLRIHPHQAVHAMSVAPEVARPSDRQASITPAAPLWIVGTQPPRWVALARSIETALRNTGLNSSRCAWDLSDAVSGLRPWESQPREQRVQTSCVSRA